MEIHFFFIKVKESDVMRIEIPSWVSDRAEFTEKIHASVLEDSLSLGYPYVLAAAHQNVTIPLDIANSLHCLSTNIYLQEGDAYNESAKQRFKGI